MGRPKKVISVKYEEAVLRALDYAEWRTIGEVSKSSGLIHYRAKRALRDLMWKGIIESTGRTKGTKYRIRGRTESVPALKIPAQLEAYFKLPRSFVSVAGYCDDTGLPTATAHRYLKEWVVEGLVEMDPMPRLTPSKKRVYMYRRRFAAITFNQDGSVYFHRLQPTKPL